MAKAKDNKSAAKPAAKSQPKPAGGGAAAINRHVGYVDRETEEVCAALIHSVGEDEVVDLTVFTNAGPRVERSVSRSKSRKSGSWHFLKY